MRRSKLLVIAASVMSTSCSLQSPSQTPLHIEIPRSAELSRNAFHSRAQSTPSNYTTAPASLSDFDCFAVNVTAPEIPPPPGLQSCTLPTDIIGAAGGWVSTNPTTSSTNSSNVSIDLMVPSGPSRLIQIYGVRTADPCPTFGDFKSARLGDIYLIGSVTQDIFDDTDASITAKLDPAKKALTSCQSNSAPINLGTTTYYVLGPTSSNVSLQLPNSALYKLTSVSSTSRGSSTAIDDGSHLGFFYNPNSNTGIDQFTYTATDSSGKTGTGNIIIKNVTPTTWTGEYGDHKWSGAGNWCGSVNYAHSACTNSGPAPATSSTVIFDGTCVAANCSATIDTSATITSLYLDADYAGTITQSAASTGFQITNTLRVRGGTIQTNNVNNSFYNPGQTIIDGGSLIAGTGSMSLGLSSGVTISNGLLDLGSSVSVSLGNVTISGGTLHAPEGGAVTYNGTIYSTGGTINSGTNPVSQANILNPGTPLNIQDAAPITFQNLSIQSNNSSGTYSINGSINVLGTLNLDGISTAAGGTPALSGGSIGVLGNLTVNSGMTGYLGSTQIILNGPGAQTITTGSSANFPAVFVSKRGSLSINNSSPLALQSVSATTVEHVGTGELSILSSTVYVGTLTQNGTGTTTFSTSTLNGNLDIQTGTCVMNNPLHITGNLTVSTGATLNQSSHTLIVDLVESILGTLIP